jgi:broad specificity phosphatase PhoE
MQKLVPRLNLHRSVWSAALAAGLAWMAPAALAQSAASAAAPEPQAVAPQGFGYAAGPIHNPAPLLGGGKVVREALQKGGYIIYFRHGRTQLDQVGLESGNRAEGKINFARCDTQRNLSDEGRAELKAAGEAFRQAAIPLDKALASPYCRTKETAALLLGAPSSQAVGARIRAQELPLLAGVPQTDARTAQLEQLFSQRPASGKNTVIVAHGMTLRALTGFAIGEGHALVLEPGNFKNIVARIAPGEWAGVANGR